MILGQTLTPAPLSLRFQPAFCPLRSPARQCCSADAPGEEKIDSDFRSPERLCRLYYIMKLLDSWMFNFCLLDKQKTIIILEIKTKPRNIFEHSRVNFFAGCLCIIIYIYTRQVLALIFLVHFPVYSILNSKSEILNGRVLLGKSELETLSCFLFNNLFQGIPRNFRIIQFINGLV